jgi:hypothetical protein
MAKSLTRRRLWIARGIALTADAVQLVFLPLFAGGAPEGFDAALDAAVCAILCGLCGLHPAFLPAFVAEALPGVDLVPSWTIAVLYVTRDAKQLPAREPDAAAEGTPKKFQA